MKKFLAIALLIVLVASVFVIASSAAEEPNYWVIDTNRYVEAKEIVDANDNKVVTVPTFKALQDSETLDGLIVGLPTYAVRGDNENASEYGYEYFLPGEGCTIEYIDKYNDKITDPAAHIGTTDRIVVYKDGAKVAEYGLVTYGDADGDGVFDVIDAAIAALCHTGKMESTDNPAVYEAMKPVSTDDVVDNQDYQQVVNDSLKEEKDLEENLKGRKTPIDDTLSFESVIYANTGAERAANVTANDSRVKYTIKYNDVDTVPKASGIYSVTAEVADSQKYLVNPGTRELGFIVIAPETGTGYTAIADNANKKITISINNYNAADTTFDGYISNWYNSAYNLKVNGNTVSDREGGVTALAPRVATKYTHEKKVIYDETDKKNYSYYHTRPTPTTDILGCYLPDDNTLWQDNHAEKIVPVSVSDGDKTFNYTISFKQNEAELRKLEEELMFNGARASGARGQRTDNPATYSNFFNKIFLECKRRHNAETGKYENVTRVINYKGTIEIPMALSIAGTGFKTVLLGDNDTIAFLSANKKSEFPAVSENNMTYLYDVTQDNLRFSSYDEKIASNSTSVIFDLVDKVLNGMNLPITVNSSTNASKIVGNSGWCRYLCADDTTGLRFTSDYLLEFVNVNASQDTHRTLSVAAVDGCTINVRVATITNPAVNLDRMTAGEPFRVTAKLADGYKLSVKEKSSGKEVYYEAEHDWYIMPNADVTVTAVKA